MVPIADDSTAAGQATEPGNGPIDAGGPVRAVVHVILAIYLSPVILVVCLIGATSILAGRMLSLVRQVGNRWEPQEEFPDRPRSADLHGEKIGASVH